MSIDTIREAIADKLSNNEYETWAGLLEDTNPAHYGVEDINVGIGFNDIWVDIPKKNFTFKNVELSFSLRLGGSSDKNGYDEEFTKTVSGHGEFEFSKNDSGVVVRSFGINEYIDLYSER